VEKSRGIAEKSGEEKIREEWRRMEKNGEEQRHSGERVEMNVDSEVH
jgi:hypothetical protein